MHTTDDQVDDRLDRPSEVDLRACCAADAWVEAVTSRRPFPSLAALLDASDAAVLALDDAGLEQALSAHPRIGERAGGEAREHAWSRAEQAGALSTGTGVAAGLARGNRAYEQRFGRVFLVRASGRTPEQMYDELRARLANDDDTERDVVLHELADIVRRRLVGLAELVGLVGLVGLVRA